jgi:uncharacterized protein (DUF1697 family)
LSVPRTSKADKHVALLRGVNVGGKNKLPMKELAELFEVAGCSDVATYIQSGNVIFCAKTVLRAGAEPGMLHVVFLADEPTRAAIGALDPKRSPGDEFVVRGREIYLRCPNGMGRSKLTNAYFDSKLSTTSTLRNWRTVLELRDRAG